MMIYFESECAAASYIKGDRVAYKMDKNEWYIGTVSRVFTGNIAIIFDDGGKFTTEHSSKLKKVEYRKRISAMTDAQVKTIVVKTTTKKTSEAKTAAPSSTRTRSRSTPPVRQAVRRSRADRDDEDEYAPDDEENTGVKNTTITTLLIASLVEAGYKRVRTGGKVQYRSPSKTGHSKATKDLTSSVTRYRKYISTDRMLDVDRFYIDYQGDYIGYLSTDRRLGICTIFFY